MLTRLTGAATWRLKFLLTDPVFTWRERLAYVNPVGEQLELRELVSRSLRRGPDGEPYYALAGWRFYFLPEAGVTDELRLRKWIELVLRESFLQDELFSEEVRVGPGDVAFDLGGSIGTCALDLARRVGPEGRVHTFEPLTADVLARNVRENGVQNVEVVPCAVADEVGRAALSFDDDLVDASLARPAGDPEETQVKEVQVTTVDAYVEERGLERVDLLKLDVEGAEELVLRGARRTLERFRPRLTIASYHTDHEGEKQHPKLVRLLHEQGYRTREVEARRIYAW